jgi:hypothetical protein
MDNYFKECPPMMDDGRGLTDFRSSQVREELFRYKNGVSSENESRTFRINNGEQLMDNEWNKLRESRSCFPKQVCFHQSPTTRVTSAYNNAEILAYNGDLEAPKCAVDPRDYRMTSTNGSRVGKSVSKDNNVDQYAGYPKDRCPVRIPNSNRLQPERLYLDDHQ